MNDEIDQQTTEVRETRAVDGDTNVRRQSVAQNRTVGSGVVLARVIRYIAGVIIALLALRVILLLLGANQGAPFVDFIYGLAGFFAWPFYGIFNYQPTYGQSTLEVSSIVAIIVYALIAWGLVKLCTLNRSQTDV